MIAVQRPGLIERIRHVARETDRDTTQIVEAAVQAYLRLGRWAQFWIPARTARWFPNVIWTLLARDGSWKPVCAASGGNGGLCISTW